MGSRVSRFFLFVVGFTLPLQAFSLVDIGFRMTPFKLATAILLAMGALGAATGAPRARDNKLPWIFAFLVAFGVSVVQGALRGVPIPPLIQVSVTYSALLAYYVLIGYVVRKREDMVALLAGLVVGGVTSALPAVLGLQEARTAGRYAGLSGQENLFGIDMTVVIAVGLAFLVTTRSFLRRGLVMGALVIAMGGVFLSLSRTAFVAGLGMWSFWTYRTGRLDTIRYAVPAVLVLVLAVLMAPDTFSERIDTMIDPAKRAQDGAIQGRLEGFELGARAFVQSPLIGVGQLNYIPWARSQPDGRYVGHVIHNAYLAIAAEQGLFSLIPYLMILFLSWRHYTLAWRLARSRRALRDPWLTELSSYALFLQVALVGIIISGMTAHAQRSKTGWMLMALSPIVYNWVQVRLQELASAPAAAPEPDPLQVPEARLPAWSR